MFVEQTFGRFRSAELQHAQPVWFYFPVLLLLLYPWFPLLFFPRQWFSLPARDPRIRMLAAVAIFGFVFFSVMLNKLPGYLLPLAPEAFALMGIGLARADRPGVALIVPLILLGALPLISEIAPGVLAHGLRSANIPWDGVIIRAVICVVAAGIVGAILALTAQRYAFGIASALAGIGFLWFQLAAFPQFDAAASARPLWLASHPQCAPPLSRSALYGLYYYAERQIPPCPVLDHGTTRGVR